MKKFFIYWVCFFCIGLYVVASSHIDLSPKEYDFGRVLSDSKYSYTVKLTNLGETVVKLTKIKATCGCTVPVLKNNILKPGETADLLIQFDSGSFRGQQRKFVYVFTDKGDKYRIAFSAFVMGKFEFYPDYIKLTSADIPFKQTIKINSNLKGNNFSIKEIKSIKGVNCKKLEDMLFELKISDEKNLKHENDIVIFLNNYNKPLVYKIFYSMTNDIQLAPKTIPFLNLKKGVSASKDCLMVTDNDLKVVDVSCNLPWLKYKGNRKTRRGLVIQVETIPDKMVKGFGKGVVLIKLKDEKNNDISVNWPVIFNILQ